MDPWVYPGRANYQIISKYQDNLTILNYLKSLILHGQEELNTMDVGSGNGFWGRALAEKNLREDLPPAYLRSDSAISQRVKSVPLSLYFREY